MSADREVTIPSQSEFRGLHSDKSSLRLQQIAELRSRGIGDHVDLPQLVVCGDQSAGKSSVLEGLTGLPFPRQDGVCTKFATEIILQHSTDNQTILASIIPSKGHSDAVQTKLRSYSRRLASFDELPSTIEDVGHLMGIRGFKDIINGPAFGQDVLRIEVSGPSGLHLTVVDLPGMISVANEEQTDGDVETVQNLVDSYVSNPRTIILAVIQASNDIANQSIVQKSRRFDKNGQRTVGIITKPDLINAGTEKRIALLAKNQDTTKLKLGFFLVKNPSPTELQQDISVEQRQRSENQYFQHSPWLEQGLAPERVGILSLRTFLQTLLDQHIERELPKVREEIRKMLLIVEKELAAMGNDRPTAFHLRTFLSRLAMRFHDITTSALNGTYHETDADFFREDDESRRLRARVHALNGSFAAHMRRDGQKRKIRFSEASRGSSDSEDEPEEGQLLVTEDEMKAWVRGVYIQCRGKELPGNYNHILLSRLFHAQSSRWSDLAADHLDSLHEEIEKFLLSALEHVVKEELVRDAIYDTASGMLQVHFQKATDELDRLREDECRQPITYNHYYTDNVQSDRQESLKRMIRKAMNDTAAEDWNGKLHISNNQLDGAKLLASLQSRIEVDMDAQACDEALSGLRAYYKVALKTFVDNVCRQVVERHMLQVLPQIFGPETIAAYSDEEVQRIGAEMPERVEKRRQLRELRANLASSLRDLRR